MSCFFKFGQGVKSCKFAYFSAGVIAYSNMETVINRLFFPTFVVVEK